MIQIKNLSKIYQSKHMKPVEALKNVSFDLPEQGLIFLVGRSGSGKTTLLNLLGGLDFATEGEILVDGISTKNFKTRQFDAYRNTYVGFIFQEYNLLPTLNVKENVGIALELQGKKATKQAVCQALQLVELNGYEERRLQTLSGGQRQRVSIARTLVKNPYIILADEPTGALDSETGKQIFEILKKLSADKLVVVVSHDREYAEQYADRIIELADGKIISDRNLKPKIVSSKQPTKPLLNAKMTLKTALKFALHNISCKKISFSIAVILSAFSFLLVGVADMFATYDKRTTLINSLRDTQNNYITLQKEKQLTHNGISAWYQDGFKLDQEDLNRLSQKTGQTIKGVYRPPFTELNFEQNYGYSRVEVQSSPLYASAFSGFMEMTAEDLKAFGFSLLAGDLPAENTNQIAISSYVYELFLKAGYGTYCGPVYQSKGGATLTYDEFQTLNPEERQLFLSVNETPPINYTIIQKPEDLLQKTLFLGNANYTISGIIDTKFDYSLYEADSLNSMRLQELAYEKEYGIHCLAFVGKGKIVEISSTFPAVVSVDGLNIKLSNESVSISSDSIARLSDIDLSLAGLQDHSGEISALNQYDFLVPFNSISTTSIQVDGKTYYESGYSLPWEERKKNLSFSVSYNDHRIGFTAENVNVLGVMLGEASINRYNISDLLVVSDSLFERLSEGREGLYTYALTTKPAERTAISDYLSQCTAADHDMRYGLISAISYELEALDGVFQSLMTIFRYIGLALCLFAIVIFAQFISGSIHQKGKEIHILRSLGAGTHTIFRIYYAESIFTALITFLLSGALTWLAAPIGNQMIKQNIGFLLSILHCDGRQLLILLSMSLILSTVSSLLFIFNASRIKGS